MKKDGDNSESQLVKIPCPAEDLSKHPNLTLVDTTGAGDTYTAAFAVRYNEMLVSKKKRGDHHTGDSPNVSDSEYLECM